MYSFSATAGMDQLKETVTIGGMSNNSLKYCCNFNAGSVHLTQCISGVHVECKKSFTGNQDVSNFIDFEGLSVQIRC